MASSSRCACRLGRLPGGSPAVLAAPVMGVAAKAVLGLTALAVFAVTVHDQLPQALVASVEQPVGDQPSAPEVPEVEPGVAPAIDAQGDWLQPTGDGDGDSWHDTSGREYRLGLVNAPETNECFGSEATARRKELTAGGFRADVYTTDTYGRSVAVVRLPDGTNLNVWLARHGYTNDRYLERFRSENEALGAELDRAFAAARADRVGLWGACAGSAPQGIAAPPPAPPPPVGDCHPDYSTCIPIRGDGSGRGRANDLNCGSIGTAVHLRRAGVDPYGLDGEGNGVGCQ